MSQFKEFKQKTWHLINNPKLFEKMELYVEMIEQANQNINLTGFSDDQIWQEGIFESLISFQNIINNQSINQSIKILDVGSGAGFPGVPLKIALPSIDLTIYEPMQKRVNFLNAVSDKLTLNLKVFKIRCEEATSHHQFDYVIARAVAPLKTLIEITHHLGKIKSHFIFIKGPNYQIEINDAQKIIQALKINLKIKTIKITNKTVVIISYLKTIKTPPNLPRPWHIIKSEKLR